MMQKILVATDGSASSIGALRMARWLVARYGARAQVLGVYEPVYLPGLGPGEVLPPTTIEYSTEGLDDLRSRVSAQISGFGEDWADEVSVQIGPITPTIARVAAERGAELILLGLSEAGGLQHWWARETLLRLVHLSHVPVLAVPAGASRLPRSAVVATDFSDFSARAARSALALLRPKATLHLVHVMTEFESDAGWTVLTEWAQTYRAGVERRLAALAEALRLEGAGTVHVHIRTGRPAEQIFAVAEETEAGMIAIGSHGAGFLGRVVMGSVSGRVIHQARQALLIAPPTGIPAELGLELSEAELVAGLGNAGEVALPESAPVG